MIKHLLIGLCLLILAACDTEPQLGAQTYILQSDNRLTITLNLDMETGRYTGKAVNRYFGTFRTAGSVLVFNTPATGMMMGSERAMRAEETYLNRLTQVRRYHLTHTDLTLILEDGTQLIFNTGDL